MTSLCALLNAKSLSARDIALQRRHACHNDDSSLACQIVGALQESLDAFQEDDPLDSEVTNRLHCLLSLHLVVSKLDPALSQELAQEGSHGSLLKLLAMESDHMKEDEKQDTDEDDPLELLQNIACEIASLGNFPVRNVVPFTMDEIKQRLPFEFVLKGDSALPILVHQVVTTRQTAQSDVGFVLWPSAVYLARWLEQNASIVLHSNDHTILNRTILELGSGCGLCGLVAASVAKQHSSTISHTMLTDFNETVLQNASSNICLNDLQDSCGVVGLDFYQQSGDSLHNQWIDMFGHAHEPVDVIIAADIICQPSDATAIAKTLVNALRHDGCAYIVCATAKHRFGVQCFPEACASVGLDVNVTYIDLQGALALNELLLKDLQQSSGYIDGMQLQMFVVRHKERNV
ncbi:hypothetical protein MPSEU_000357500 [Mayamaea pseudoterrestris]|nr:hypothetical protein MPSEU_000357500 [Mayamaea pseudoterrestris]